ncbi:hypothetical protein THAOC_03705 [Thalassiosira oceanica]|uniref:Protein kinase domain-containing protein n=1 Tax=Thalassiosira oceanica TaxID=159749 RepID=K0T758_THAOC|nr:hypothetical protein THAOC_03705 [Thalassiosira oceanica]|eukprot:EJK74608.1 hypothetical protein THAOC_03705 [Thalassiosira oceanica]
MPLINKKSSTNTRISQGLESLLIGGSGSSSVKSFEATYKIGRKLMGGSYGTVYEGVNIKTKREFAIKVIERRKLSKHDDASQIREVEILRSLNPLSFTKSTQTESSDRQAAAVQDPNNGIINLVDFYSSPNQYHIVMELARGGDVFDRLAKRKVYTEANARDLCRSMLESVQFLHERGIAHRDIKPENLLLMDEDSDTQLKLADFGFARRFSQTHPDHSMKTKCGTPAFVPPELVLGQPYGPKCDIWSAGCTLFMLLSGRAPFNAKKSGKNAMFRAIRAGDFVFYDDYWKNINIEAKKLVLNMLQVDPSSRMSAKEALESEWINMDDDALRRSSLDKSLAEIVSFSARRKLRGAIGAVMYAVGGGAKFWDISATAFSRDDMHSTGAVNGDQLDEAIAKKEFGKPEKSADVGGLDSTLQEGVEATVWHGTRIDTRKTYAIKVIKRKGLTQSDDATVLNEVSILKSLRHKHIVPLRDFFEEPDTFYLVMHKCRGGDVLDRVASIEQYSEKDARQFSRGLLDGVAFMSERGIAHRDLKPQNLLLEREDDNTQVKICDFGYAKRVYMPQSLTTLCGSLHYVAPELLKNHPYDQSADMWSVGVIIYFLLVGYLPFHSKNQDELFKIIRLGKFSFEPKYWSGISKEAKDLISKLLDVDPSTRLTATQALNSDWMSVVEEKSLVSNDLSSSSVGIRRFSGVSNKTVQWMSKKNKLNLSNITVDSFISSLSSV